MIWAGAHANQRSTAPAPPTPPKRPAYGETSAAERFVLLLSRCDRQVQLLNELRTQASSSLAIVVFVCLSSLLTTFVWKHQFDQLVSRSPTGFMVAGFGVVVGAVVLNGGARRTC